MLFVVAVAALVYAPALAATPEEAAAGLIDGVYIEPSAEAVDTESLAASRAAAADAGIELSVIVLAEAVPDAVAFAELVGNVVPGTVLVFTPDAYGASSTDLSQPELTAALDDAGDRLAGGDVARGVDAFVDAAASEPVNWGAIIVIGLIVVAAVAAGGRIIERRATATRRHAALMKEYHRLEARADVLASPILELSTRVELDGRADLIDRYRIAASEYGALRDQLAREPTADDVDAVDARLDGLDAQVDALEAALDTPR